MAMHPRVTAVFVATTAAGVVQATLDAVAAQTRAPDRVVAVDVASRDATRSLLERSFPGSVIALDHEVGFGEAVMRGVRSLDDEATDAEWLWLLGHDNAPEPGALRALLAAVERAPSVGIAGPKLARAVRRDTIASFGQTLTRLGATVQLVDDELDQAQHDQQHDVLGVSAQGMLVRRDLLERIGFDPALPNLDAGLDLAVRARLAGARVVTVPDARISTAGSAETFGRGAVTPAVRRRLVRTAQLHRRLAYAPWWAVPLHWLALLPLAVGRSAWHLLRKRPGAVFGEFAAALTAMLRLGAVAAARGRIRRTRTVGWKAIAPLRMSPAEVRERRAQHREASAAASVSLEHDESLNPATFAASGGVWTVLALALVSVVLWWRLLGADAASGGALLPLSTEVSELWRNLYSGWRDLGAGFAGAADPFSWVLAALGSLTFWQPSAAVIAFAVAAIPLAGLTAWFAARDITTHRTWVPAVAAVLWALAPMFLAALGDGRLGAVLAHTLLPVFALALLRAHRSWPASASASLLLAAIGAGAPSLVTPLALAVLVVAALRLRRIVRVLGVLVPVLALFAPLAVQQVLRGTPLGLLADPGAPLVSVPAAGWRLALGFPEAGLGGWYDLLAGVDAGATAATPWIVGATVAPVALLAVAALAFAPLARAAAALAVALVGYLTAVAASSLAVAADGADAVPLWPGGPLTLYWLGLVAAAALALDGIRVPRALGVVAAVGSAAAVAPLALAAVTGATLVQPSGARLLPPYVIAADEAAPGKATLVLDPEGAGLAARLELGDGSTLDDQSTLAYTAQGTSDEGGRLAQLAGNLASLSGYDPSTDLADYAVGFVLLAPGETPEEQSVTQRVSVALDGNARVTAVGQTERGLLWRFPETADAAREMPAPTPLSLGVAAAQAAVLLIAALLAIPTSRRRVRRVKPEPLAPAQTFEAEDDD
jgi:GT2 family glycosyltransferase